mgnify:CR=1 FL=1
MNISEATTTQRVLAFLAGDVDHCDETTRAALAADLMSLDERAHLTLGAGPVRGAQVWDDLLCQVTFEAA